MNEKINLTLQSQNPFVQIFLIDSDLHLVDKAIGTLEGQYAPGVYKAKFKAGNTIHEELISLEPGSEAKLVDAPEMLKYSSIPLPGIKRQIEIDLAQKWSVPQKDLSRFPALFLFVGSDSRSGPPESVLNKIILVNEDKQEAKLSTHGIFFESELQLFTNRLAVAAFVHLQPGNYILRYEYREPIELNIVLCPGWETQIFVTASRWQLDFHNASISMSREGFVPQAELKHCELARIALSNNAPVISNAETMSMLHGKFENPMLGIYGAHLILLKKDVEDKRNLMRTVFNNLYNLVGPHPDVMIIGLWLKKHFPEMLLPHQGALEDFIFIHPPMLLNSWRILVSLSCDNKLLIQTGSVSAEIAGNTIGHGPWVIWRLTEQTSFDRMHEMTSKTFLSRETGWDDLKSELLRKLPQAFAFLLEVREDRSILRHIRLSKHELNVLKYLDHVLPVEYVRQLYGYISSEGKKGKSNYVESMLPAIGPSTIELFKDACAYVNSKDRLVLQTVVEWLSTNALAEHDEHEEPLINKVSMVKALHMPYATLASSIRSLLNKIRVGVLV